MRTMRVSGIYNLDIAQLLHESKIHHWGFDLRPRSMNFVQGSVLEDCLRFDTNQKIYYLKFENEKAFIIDSFIKRLEMRLPRLSDSSLCLEFTDANELSFYESFSLPFVWHFKKEIDYQKFFRSSKFLLLSISSEDIEKEGGVSEQFQFLNHLFGLAKTFNKKLELRISASDNWDNSIWDFYSFDSLLLEIDSSLETSYRLVDKKLLFEKIEQTKLSLSI